jgi:ubiquinone biosynthesis protein
MPRGAGRGRLRHHGRLGFKERRFLAEILYGFITRDYRRVSEVHFEAGYVPAHHSIDQFAQAIRAIGEPIHDRPAREISMARLLTLLFEITGLFDMRTRTELVLLQKTMIVVEGVSRGLDPDFDMWSASEPVIRELDRAQSRPHRQALEELGRARARCCIAVAGRLPDTLERAERRARPAGRPPGERGFALSESSVEAIGRAEARRNRWGNLALWTSGGIVAVIYAMIGG